MGASAEQQRTETMSFDSFYFYTTAERICKSQPNSQELDKQRNNRMIELRPFAKLGAADHGWLKAKHHFSFSSYYDPSNLGHGSLRVWNDDEIAPNTGFPAHPHANMEIITYVREGAITHQDSLGNKGRTEAGDVQVMSAGSGIRHSEYNLEPTKTKIFQIWIEPNRTGGQPTWGAKPFPKAERSGRLITLASGFVDDTGALPIRAAARVLATTLKAGQTAEYAADKSRHLYLVPAAGAVDINGVRVNARDGAAIRDEKKLKITALEDAELVLVDAA
jgi:quercetin 2,3-dioxygenase